MRARAGARFRRASVHAPANAACRSPGEREAPFSFGASDSFKLKGSINSGQYAYAWLYLGDKDAFNADALKVKMDLSQNDGAMHFALDPAILTPRGVAA